MENLTDEAKGEIVEDTPNEQTIDLHRTFKARHIQMICLGANLSSGLFVSTGKALRYGSASGMLIGYSIVCSAVYFLMNVLTEATCLWPTSGSFIDHATRFVDPALGFAMGFCEWFAYMTIVASEAAIVRVILSWWTTSIPTAACMTVFLAIVFAIHALPNRWFAEFEFVTACAKVIMMLVLIFACIAMLAGAGEHNGTAYAWNYTSGPVFPNGFKGICQAIPLAVWAVGGQEIMGISAGEAQMPRWDMPRACKNLIGRLIIFYELSIVFMTLLVPYNNPNLLGTSSVAASPFVIALQNAKISVLPSLLNAVILLGLCGNAAEAMYIASRVLTAMARMGMMPGPFKKIDSRGRPYLALIATAVCSTVCTYINCSGTGAQIFTWFSSISSTVFFMAWLTIAITNIQMRRAIRAQNDPAFRLPHAFRLRGYPFPALTLLTLCLACLGMTAYVSVKPIGSSSSAEGFFEIFLGVPVFVVAYLGYKLYFRTKLVKPLEADLVTGRRLLTPQDVAMLDEYYAQPGWKRALSYVRF
ncbi:AAT family amino acid transporter [Aspergillus homomorphus CBS 101889]|uniref:AAT family amino acid transporter n=1 Tax=Aspergillus homomorphus (strain CBS 101889) TaxID=1450537 RepID=A0A395I286_ASPHC|nr:AAT family amino acid transporter [Aspergillus homomorphus CBS 101889]RAL12674.1 AAT family amino acid transporter [Aspergillus homomorphus CBS 101889]